MTSFDHFSPEALRFLAELKDNNNREWFAQNKGTYEAEIKAPTKLFLTVMCGALKDATGQAHGGKIYRINRDVRFSPDKRPYNAHVHASFVPESKMAQPPMWFFGLSPEKLSLGCGVFQYDKETLPVFRDEMAGPKGATLIKLSQELAAAGVRISEPQLKRVPSGYDKDHPNQEALRRKGFSAWLDIGDAGFVTSPHLVKRTTAELMKLRPVFALLSEIGST